ncbi:MAG: alpha/beta hydrolase [Verrucomicrobia bacterium]|nr:alpha/beta hydrolase [Verrucomicrobiota bacterium]
MKAPLMFLLAVALAATAGAGVKTDIEYGTAGGERLKLDAYVPEGAGPFPAVILVHGGGWTGGDKSGGPKKGYMAPLHAPLEKAGFAWFSINYRLAPRHRYPACIEDVETAIRWVKARAAEYRVDPRRIALAGESAGGHLVALAAVRMDESTRLAAVVPIYGLFDLTAGLADGEPLRKNFVALFGREKADAESLALLRQASPLHQVRPGLPPMLLLHGDADKTVPYDHSTRLLARLRAAGVPGELITIPGGPHGMLPWDALAPDFKDRVVAWLGKTLGR